MFLESFDPLKMSNTKVESEFGLGEEKFGSVVGHIVVIAGVAGVAADAMTGRITLQQGL